VSRNPLQLPPIYHRFELATVRVDSYEIIFRIEAGLYEVLFRIGGIIKKFLKK